MPDEARSVQVAHSIDVHPRASVFHGYVLFIACTIGCLTASAMTASISSRIDADGLQQLFNVSHSLAPRAVLVQVAVMTALSILTIITFNILRPNNKFVYEPKVKYHPTDKRPPRISESFFGWITPLIHNHESELLNKSGLDAVVFLRFLHLLRWLFTLVALIACGALIPLDFLYTLSIQPTQYDILSAMSIRDVRGVRLYAHIGSTYLFTAILMFLLHHHWKGIYRLRNQWFRSTEYQHLFHVRVLCITHIPPRRQSDEGLYNIFVGMQLPYPVTSVRIGRHVGDLPKLLEKHNDAVRELEEAVAKYTRDGESVKVPTITVGGFLGLGGTRVDAITYYTSKVKQAEGAVQQYRAQMDPNRTENYGFATISTIPFAHAAALELRGQHPKGLTIKLAPNPKDIIWHNLGLSRPSRQFRRVTGFLLLAIFSFLSLIPLFPVASLANLDALAASGVIPFLRTWSTASPISFTLVSGTFPTAIASLFSYFLPRLMRWLSEYMGASTYSGLDRIVVARYYSFLIISQLIIFTALGVVFQSVFEIVVSVQKNGINLRTILHNLDKLPAKITHTYVNQSSFWLKWFPMQGFFIIFNLAQLVDLVWLSFRNRVYGRTPREIREFSRPPVFGYAMNYSSLLFMATVGLLFAPLAPLVSLAAAVVFWLCSWIYKYQLMFVFVTHVETGGRMWNVVANRLLVGAMFMQVIMVLTIGLQDQFKSLQFIASLPPLFFLLIFKHYLNQKYANLFQYYIPGHADISRAIVHTEASDGGGDKLEERYCHPALKTDLFSPMIHSRALALLRQVYGRKSHPRDRARSMETKKSRVRLNGLESETAVQGVSFHPVHEDALEYDPEQYRRDREMIDCDYDSFPSTPADASVVHPHDAHPPSRHRRGVQLHDPGPTPGPTHHSSKHQHIERRPTTTVTSPAPSYQTVNPVTSPASPQRASYDSRRRRNHIGRHRPHEPNVATEAPRSREPKIFSEQP